MRWSIADMNIRRDEGALAAELCDAVLADLYAAPYTLCEPPARTVPFVFASPHSGRLYPERLLRLSRLSRRNLRCSEDAYVDQLISDVIGLGAPLVFARFPRAYLDVNRAPAELDESMIESPLHLPVEHSSPRVQAGLGVIPRIVRDGAEIYRVKLKTADVEERLYRLHRRYHAALATLVRETHAKFGTAVVVDCHSMPSAAGAPDIVLGDRYGTAASQVVLRHAEDALLAQGFSVGRNVPYAGGYTTHLYGEPARGIHALQIEINRRLYLDEERIELAPTFSQVQRRLMAALRNFTSIDVRALRPQRGMRFAAE
jgi:N-formylglutamate amidohydrolase